MTQAGFRFDVAPLTDVGGVRQVNEDSMLARTDAGVWVVADGMGGHENGQWASRAIVEAVNTAPIGHDFDASADALAQAIHAANGRIFEAATQAGKQMGSTVVALMIHGRRFCALWAGDSRIYLWRGGRLHRLTRDHSQVQAMVDRGMLTPEEAHHHPMSHVLARAVGVEPTLELDAVTDEVETRDVFLLCSDGLTGVVDDDEIAERLSEHGPQTAARWLLDLVLSRGAPDNVTLIVTACDEITLLTLAPA